MSSLVSGLRVASDSLDALEKAMGVVQNNVSNASTDGYVTQSLDLVSQPFELSSGLTGGVRAGSVTSARSQYAEQSVWTQNSQLGDSTQSATSLNSLQALFDVSGTSGIPSALTSLYAAFSAWSTSPDDSTARQQVLSAAQTAAQAFNSTASNLQQLQSQADTQLQSTVTQINSLSSQIANINGQIRSEGGQADAGLEAQLYSTLESLSNLTSISVQTESDGTATVLMDGQSPLVLGQNATTLQVSYASSGTGTAGGAPAASIVTSTGQDVTSTASQQGQLGGLLQFRNVTLPSVMGSDQQQGSLNELAQSIADRVNSLLTSGQVSSGPPAVSGSPLFSYSSTAGSSSVAATLSVDPNITASTLAAIQPASGTTAAVANGIADQLSQLANPTDSASMLNGMSYTDFYGGIATDIGNQESNATANQQSQTQLLTQAQNMRAQVSGVSLNDQAAELLQYQQAYEASAQLITTINNTTAYLMNAFQNLQ